MSRIALLPERVYNRIAAGEVVERPASVLKELVENSIDAGASNISIRIGGAGVSLIAVSDDGAGMDADDALLCFEPHATSKIKTENDLDAISSLGFRGEALPSIASVAKVTLHTRQKTAQEGVEVVIDGGKLLYTHPCGCAPGTEVTVRELFFNTPARRKFLKTHATEEKHIAELISNIALAHPTISFQLTFDGRTFLDSTASADIAPRIREIFGRDYAANILPLSYTEHGITVAGFIAKRSFTKPSRSEQRTFVNSRPVESPAIYRGIREGFGPTLDKGRHPPCILYIALPPDRVDVNVHPAKREVRFLSDYEVTAVVRNAVGAALRTAERELMGFAEACTQAEETEPEKNYAEERNNEVSRESVSPSPFRNLPPPAWAEPEKSEKPGKNIVSELTPEQETAFILQSAAVDYTPVDYKEAVRNAADLPGLEQEESQKEQGNSEKQEFQLHAEHVSAPEAETEEQENQERPLGLRIIGVFADSYILAERHDGLVVIDQHAAHERILFERLLNGAQEVRSQKLLLPITMELSRADTVFLSKNAEAVAKLGFEAEPFGTNTIKLSAIPSALEQNAAGAVFREMLALAEDEAASQVRRADVDRFAMAACKAAVKAHDHLSKDEINSLLRQLAECEQPFACPHGRPTIINIAIKELEHRFGRR